MALHLEVLVDERLEGVEVAAGLVIPARRAGLGVEVLERGVPADIESAAEVLVHGAVHVADDDAGRPGVEIAELVPRGGERLAVAAPRGVELDDGVLAGLEHGGVEVVAVEDGDLGGSAAQEREDEERDGLHRRSDL